MENCCHKSNNDSPVRYLRSAGGVIFRKTGDTFEIALIAVKNKTIWTLPKGLINKGEQTEEAAIREVKEETGLTGRIVDVIGDKSYWFYLKDENMKYMKTVSYFLMEYLSGNTEDYSWEVDEARWFNIDDAIKQMSYKNDREILQKAKEILKQKWDRY